MNNFAAQTDVQANSNQGIRFVGAVAFNGEQQRVHIALDGIASDRNNDNLSGTLSIELWSLNAPYQGGYFNGECLAATQIGELWGNHWIADCDYDLIYQAPQVAGQQLCLMLREWNGVAFETRDFRTFNQALNTQAVKAAEPVLKVVTEAPRAEVVSIATSKKAVEVKDAAVKSAAVKDVAKTTAKVSVKKTSEESSLLNVNTAAEKELAAVKGLPKKVAKAIVEARPFVSLDELEKVKGLGKKTLEKLREKLKV